MNRTLFLLMALLSFQLSAMEIDSVERAKLIREGQHELCELIEYNAHVTSPDQRKFLVMIDGEPPAVTYVQEKRIDGVISPILTQQTVDAINAEIALTYTTYNVEMYVIVIKSLNFVVKAPIPAYPSAVDLFTNHLYDAQSNIQELRAIHQDLTYEIIYNTFQARGKDCMVYSRAEYSGAYVPGKVGKWTLSKHYPFYATSPTYPKLNELMSCVYDRVKNNPNVVYSNLEPALKEVAHQFYLSAKYMAVKGAIMTTYSTEGMSDIFEQFSPGADYENLTEPERRRALSVFAGYSMGENGLELEERYACRIVESTPIAQVPDFLQHLSEVSELNSSPSYQGEKPNKALVVMLIDKIDDHLFNENCYAWFMRAIIEIEMTCPQAVEANMPTTDQDWYNRRIYWDNWSALAKPKNGDHDYEIDLAENGTLTVRRSVAWLESRLVPMGQGEYTDQVHWNTYDPFTLNPFAIVVFTNRSSLGMLQIAGAQSGKPYFAPAIFLQYADDKAFNTNAITTTALIIDAITIATAGPLISAAIEAGNVAMACFEAIQLIGSTANIAANAINNPQIKEAVDAFNLIIGIWGLSKVATYGTMYTVEFIAKARASELKAIPLSMAQDYRTQFKGINNWTGIDDAIKQKLTKLDDLLKQHVEAGTLISTTKFNRSVIDALVGFEDQIATLVQSHGLSLQEFLVMEGKSFQQLTEAERNIMNAIRDAISKPTATTVMQKAIPKSDIGKYLDGSYTSCKGFMATAQDSKHLTTFEDIYYGMRLDYSQTAFQLSDGSCGVIRFKAQNSATSVIPRCPANGGVEIASMPFTGHGFTSANNGRLGVPEWQMSSFAVMESAELWEVFSDGHEVLRATYNKNLGKFVPTP